MLTLNHGVERVDGGQVGSDADVLVSAGRLQVHGDGPVHVAMEVGDHPRREGDIGQAALAVVAEGKGRGSGSQRKPGSPRSVTGRSISCTHWGKTICLRAERDADGGLQTRFEVTTARLTRTPAPASSLTAQLARPAHRPLTCDRDLPAHPIRCFPGSVSAAVTFLRAPPHLPQSTLTALFYQLLKLD